MQRNDRLLIERREKQEAALAASQKIVRELTLWHQGERASLTGAEITSIIFTEFEFIPRQ